MRTIIRLALSAAEEASLLRLLLDVDELPRVRAVLLARASTLDVAARELFQLHEHVLDRRPALHDGLEAALRDLRQHQRPVERPRARPVQPLLQAALDVATLAEDARVELGWSSAAEARN